MPRTKDQVEEGKNLLHYVIYHNSSKKRNLVDMEISEKGSFKRGTKGVLILEMQELMLICQLTKRMPILYPPNARIDSDGFPHMFEHPIKAEVYGDLIKLRDEGKIYTPEREISIFSKTPPEETSEYAKRVNQVLQKWYRDGLSALVKYSFERDKAYRKGLRRGQLLKEISTALEWPRSLVSHFDEEVKKLSKK